MHENDRFSKDNFTEFSNLCKISKKEFQEITSWIGAPQNLQQFCAVTDNLLSLFNLEVSEELLHDLELEDDFIAKANDVLTNAKQAFENLPENLQILSSNKRVRPSGIIQRYPIYATLVADSSWIKEIDEEELSKYRMIHLVVLATANNYKKLLETGEITELNTGFETALREVRALEKDTDRPSVLPDWRDAESLTEILGKR